MKFEFVILLIGICFFVFLALFLVKRKTLKEINDEGLQLKPKISFLIGSGFSYFEGIASVGDINKEILSRNMSNLYHDYEQRVHTIEKGEERRFTPDKFKNEFFEAFVKFYVDEILEGEEKEFNYETFFDFARQYDRGVSHYKEKIEDFYSKYVQDKEIHNPIDCRNAVYSFMTSFNQIVANKLYDLKYFQNNLSNDYNLFGFYSQFLKFLLDLRENHQIEIHSLNHDMFLEWMLQNLTGLSQLDYTDGFVYEGSNYYSELVQEINEEISMVNYVKLRKFDPKSFDKSINLYKLHGTVDTIKVGVQQGAMITHFERVKEIPNAEDFFVEKKLPNEKVIVERVIGLIDPDYLSGTTEKILAYDDAYYKEVFDFFRENLSQSDILFITGYGFNDSEINNILKANFEGQKIYIIDPKPNYENIDKLNFEADLRFYTKGVTEITATEFKEMFKNLNN